MSPSHLSHFLCNFFLVFDHFFNDFSLNCLFRLASKVTANTLKFWGDCQLEGSFRFFLVGVPLNWLLFQVSGNFRRGAIERVIIIIIAMKLFEGLLIEIVWLIDMSNLLPFWFSHNNLPHANFIFAIKIMKETWGIQSLLRWNLKRKLFFMIMWFWNLHRQVCIYLPWYWGK